MTYDKAYARDVLGADCDNCPLNGSAQFVPTTGPADASIAFVGEAPGAGEQRTGVPFTGPSGRLLDIVIDKYNIKRDEVLLTNATLCRAPDGKTPAVSAIRACKPRLHNELRAVSETVVALGNTATESILGIGGVTKLRVGPGRTSPVEGLEHLRVIPTVHPAACLRQSDMFPSLVADVAKVVASGTPWTEPDYTVLDPEAAVAFLRKLQETPQDIYVDIECDIEKDTAYDHPDRYDLLCVGIGLYDENGDIAEIMVVDYDACHDENVLDAMADAFNEGQLEAHGGKFDLSALFPHIGAQELHFDTMLASYALDERTSGIHGLKYHAVEDFGAPEYDKELDKYNAKKLGYGVIPKPVLYKYNAIDIAVGMRLAKKQKRLLETKAPSWWGKDEYTARYDYVSLRGLVDFLVEYGSNALMYLELNGIKVDREYNRELHVQYGERMDSIKIRIREVLSRSAYEGHGSFNPNSPIQVRKALAHLRIRVESTDKETVNQILDMTRDKEDYANAFEFCEILLEWRREAKLFGTYVKGVTTRLYKGRIYSTFSLHGTVTGRLASRNPNLQNIVREAHIKKQYIPGKPENVFVSVDYKQAELRVVTWMTGCEFFLELFRNPDRDFFDELTPRLYPGASVDQVGKAITKAQWKELRIRVKAFVYGLNYGRTEFSIAQELKMSAHEASNVKKNFFQTIPEIVEWQDWVQQHVRSGKDLINPFGRHRRYHLITEENWNDIKKEALAFLPQSTSSDLCLRAMARVRRDLRGTGAFVRNIVHDNIMVDCHPSIADDVGALVDRHMVESARELVGDYIPFGTDISIGKNWGELS